MADNKNTLMSSIAKDVEKIRTSKFGTKLPSNGNEEKKNTIQELAYEQMIMGTLASLVWGQVNIKKDDQVKTLLGNKKNIFKLAEESKDLIKDLYNTVNKTINDKFAFHVIINTSSINKLLGGNAAIVNTLNENTKLIDISLSENINKLLDSIAGFANIQKELQKKDIDTSAITSLVNVLNENVKTIIDSLSNSTHSLTEDINRFINALQELEKQNIDVSVFASIANILNENRKAIIESLSDNTHDLIEGMGGLSNILQELEKQNIDASVFASIANILNENRKAVIESLSDNTNKLLGGIAGLANIQKEIQKQEVKSSTITIEITDLEQLNKLVQTLSEGQSKINVYRGIETILDLLRTLDSNDFKNLNKEAKDNLDAIASLIGEKSSVLKKIFDAINKIAGDKGIYADLRSLSSIIDTIIKILQIDPNTINVRGLRTLLRITDPDKGSIAILFSNLETITKDAKLSESNFNELQNFFEALTVLGEIGFIKRRRIANNISFIKKHIIGMIPDIVKSLQKAVSDNQKDAYIAINNVSELFKAITEISELDFKHKIKLLFNLRFIKDFYINEIVDILKTIQKISDDHTQVTVNAIESLLKVFEMTLKLGDISLLKILNISLKANAITSIIENELTELFNAIVNIQNTETALLKIEDVEQILLKVEDLYKSTPGVLSSVHESLKLITLMNNIETIEELIKLLNKANKIRTTQIFAESVPQVIDDIINIFESKDYKKILNDLTDLNNNLIYFKDYIAVNLIDTIVAINSIPAVTKKKAWINSLKTILKEFDESQPDTIGGYISYLPGKEALKDFLKLGISLRSFVTIINEIEKFDDKQKENIEKILNVTKTIVEQFDETGKDNIAVHFKGITDKNIEKIDNIIKLLKKLSELGKIKFILNISEKSIATFAKIANPLKAFIQKLANIKDKDINKAKDVINTFFKVVIGGAAILLFAGFVLKKVKIGELMLFTATLAGFLFAVTAVLKIMSKSIKNDIKIAKDAFRLIVVSAATMLLGSIVMHAINPKDLVLFTLTLSAFLLATTGIFLLFNFLKKDVLKGVRDAAYMIVTAGGILLLGGILMHIINKEDLVIFTVTLSGFLLVTSLIFLIFNKLNKGVLKGLRDAAYMIMVAGGILILGGLFMKVIKPADLLIFAGTLALFILAVSGIFLLFNFLEKDALKGAKNAALLVAVSGLVLIMGGLFMKIIKPRDLLLFAGTLALFLLGITSIFLLFNKVKGQALKSAAAAAIFVAVSAFVLLIGAALLMAYPKLILYSLIFTVLLGVYIYAMIKIINHLNKNQKSVWGAIGVMVALGIVTVLAAYALKEAVKAANMVNDWWMFVGVVGVMALVIFGLYSMARALGQAGPEALGYIAIGEAIIAGLVGIVWLVGKAVSSIAEGIEDLARVSHADLDFVNLALLLLEFNYLTGPLLGLAAMLPIVGFASLSMLALRALLMSAADVVQAYASLKIPIYEGDKIVGYKILGKKDFQESAANIKCILTTLFHTVKEIYDKDPDMFSFSLSSLMMGGGGTVFGKVAAAGKGLSAMLSELAIAVQHWCDLKIPIYDNKGKIAGYKTIDNNAFQQAAINIKAVVTCLAQAILDVYDSAPEGMFKPRFVLFGDSPFEMVTTSLTTMGKMLGSIADGIKDWADLKIPIYKKGSTEIEGYITLDNDSFVTAANNIKSVVTCLAQAVLDVYDMNPELFDPQGWFGLGSSKFSIVSRALGNMGTALGNIANNIKDWSDLKIPIYKKGSTEIESYLTLSDNEFKKVGEHIKEVVTCLSQSIIDVYEDNPDMFSDTWFTDSPFTKVVNAIGPMGKSLKNIAEAVKDWAELKVPIYKEGSSEISSYLTLSADDFNKVGDNISDVVTCLISSVAELYDEHDEWFDGTGLLGMGDSPIGKVLGSIAPLGSSLKDIADAVKSWADLKIPVYNGVDKNGKPQISEYVTLGKDDFVKVTQNVNTVVTALVSAVAALYDEHDEWFDGTGLLGMGDSPIGKVLGSIAPLGSSLKDIADAVEAWAELKIPVYGGTDKNGKPMITEYKTLGKNDFVQATNNINTVVTSLVKAVAALYYDPQAVKEGWFDGGFFSGKSPVSKVLTSIEPLGAALKDIADSIVSFADFKIPIYGKGKNGEAVISGYVTLSDNDIAKAAVNIGKIVTTLAETIGALYDPHKDWFETKHWYESQTPFCKVITALEPMGNMVGGIAEGIKGFADFKIPIYKKDKIVGYHTMASADFDKATKNIGLIVTTLGNAIAKVVKDNPGIFDNDKNGQIKNAAEAIKLTGETLNGVASVIGYYASGKFPALKYDKDGKLIPGATITIGNKQIADMKVRVNKVITALGESIIDVYNNPKNKQIWDQWEGNGFKKDAPAMIVASSIGTIAKALNDTVEVIQKIVELKFEDINKKLNSQNGVKDMFMNIINGIASLYYIIAEPRSGNNIYFEKGFATWIYGKQSNVTTAANAIKILQENIDKMFKSIHDICGTYKNSKEDVALLLKTVKGKDGNDTQEISYNISNAISTLASVVNSLNNQNISNNLNTFNDLRLDDKLIEFVKIFKRINSNAISKLVESYIATSESITKLIETEIKTSEDGNKTDTGNFVIVQNYSKIINALTQLINTLNNNELSTAIVNICNNQTLDKPFDEAIRTIRRISNKIIALNELNAKMSNLQFANIADSMNKFIICIHTINQTLNGEQKDYEDNKKSFGERAKLLIKDKLFSDKQDLQKLLEDTEYMVRIVNKVIRVAKSVENINSESYSTISNGVSTLYNALKLVTISEDNEESLIRFINNLDGYVTVIRRITNSKSFEKKTNVLRDGIIQIYGATSQIVENEVFRKHTYDLKRYIESINSVKLNNLLKLKDFVDSMNELSQRLGNLDKLTDAVGNKLSAVLYDLVVQLRLAEATIKNAHTLQDKRKKLMEESMAKIEKIMGQHMIVEISQQSEDDTSSTPTGSIDGNTINDGAPTGTDNTPVTTTPREDNPENTTTANGTTTHTTKKQQGDSGMTYGQFINFMNGEYLNKIAKEVSKSVRDQQ